MLTSSTCTSDRKIETRCGNVIPKAIDITYLGTRFALRSLEDSMGQLKQQQLLQLHEGSASPFGHSYGSSMEPSPDRYTESSGGWVDEGEGALSFRVSGRSDVGLASGHKFVPPSPELYERETLSKYGDTMAR